MLRVENLSCARGPRELFRGLSFTAGAGELVLVTGPNGSGKTTLLRAIAGLTRPAAGTIGWSGAGDELAGSRAYLGHAAGWKDTLTVTENLRLAWQLDGEAAADEDGAAPAALADVGLGRQRNLAVARLSQGQKKRLHLARLTRSTRPLWLLDEPAAALDDEGLSVLAALVAEHLEQGGTAAIATHQPLGIAVVRTQNLALTG
ncbi:MAG: cytochrome c biogenesis heme-transporting ATPase CcmA [Betaproteobacteria bacterium]|nr:cytochrome c biogenesis heme-transporting ATPase CcmA [Betaproteobacteria bacterium]MBK9607795.1 cytochrome c biogenesis heme-transporting ATPase CcmA [Betaproteobacteria bacterium]